MSNQINSRKATIRNLNQALQMVLQIQTALEKDLANAIDTDSDIHWGHAGSAAHDLEELVEMRDRLYQIGEYATEA